MFLYIYVCTDIEKRPHRVHCDVTVGNRTGDSIYTKQEKVQQKKRRDVVVVVVFQKRATIPQFPLEKGRGSGHMTKPK